MPNPFLGAIKKVLGMAGSLAGGPPAVLVLNYHRVLPQIDLMMPDEPDVAMFAMQMSVIARHFRVLPLIDALDELYSGNLQTPTVAVTFDDGYACISDLALPVLQRTGVPATVFIAPGILNGGLMFNDALIEIFRNAPAGRLDLQSLDLGEWALDDWEQRRLAASKTIMQAKYLPMQKRQSVVNDAARRAGVILPDNLMLTSEQLCRLNQCELVDIGAHTVNHPILSQMNDAAAAAEICDSKADLERILNTPVELFAYPNGKPGVDYLPQHVLQVKHAGFRYAVATSTGVVLRQSDRYQLPRMGLWDRTSFRFLVRICLLLSSKQG